MIGRFHNLFKVYTWRVEESYTWGGVEWGGRFEDVESSEESHVCRGVE